MVIQPYVLIGIMNTIAILVRGRYLGRIPWNLPFAIGEVDLHTLLDCSSRCGYCYVGMKSEGKTVFKDCPTKTCTLLSALKIITKLRFVAGAKDLVFVGGDPCLHPHLGEMIVFAKGIGLNVCVLSNTHHYKMAGRKVPIEILAPYIDELDFTLHGTPPHHNAFNGVQGSCEEAFEQLKKYMAVRNENQSVGIILNMVSELIGSKEILYEAMSTAISRLGLKPGQDFFTIQRIAPQGAALESWGRWKITPEMLTGAFDTFDRIEAGWGIETRCCIDIVPWCALPKKHWHYLEPLEGGCNWGQPGGVLSIMPNGDIQRCALCSETLGVNIKDLSTPGQFRSFIYRNKTLVAVRRHDHLSEDCIECALLPKCGGGCIVANTSGDRVGDPYTNSVIPRGRDYLAPGYKQ